MTLSFAKIDTFWLLIKKRGKPYRILNTEYKKVGPCKYLEFNLALCRSVHTFVYNFYANWLILGNVSLKIH